MTVEYHETGTLRLAQEKQVAALRSWAALWSDAGVSMEVVQGDRLASLEPGLAPSYRVAVSIPGEPQVRAVSFMAAMAQAARLAGVTLLEGCQVIGVERSGARAVAVRTAHGDTLGCSHVVLAAGAWSGGASGWLGLEVPVRPLQGQSLLLPQAGPAPVRHTLFGEGIYIVPRADKTLVVGSTYDEVGFDCQVTPDGVARLKASARRLVPALSTVEVLQAGAGLRPRTPDSRPILGPNGFGVLLSPLTGRIVADVVMTGQLADIARPFTIDRFHASITSAV